MRVPFASFKAPFATSSPGQVQACANCATTLAVGQDWCVECGTAVPGRFGRGPGLRSSLGVVGVTLLLVMGAVAAAYAALSSDSKQAVRTIAGASAPAAPLTPAAAAPGGAVAIPVAPVAGLPAAPAVAPTTLPAAPKLPPATPTPTAAKTTPPTTTAAVPKTATAPATTVTKPKKKTTPAPATTPSAKSAKILLDTDAATTYNPYSLAPTSLGDPAKAIDGDPLTSWTYQLDPATAGKTHVGLAINLKSAQTVRAISIATSSPGMTVEFYGATGAQPVSITDPAWLHLANRRHIQASSKVPLKTQGKTLDYLLVWITHAPAGMTSGALGISELSVTG